MHESFKWQKMGSFCMEPVEVLLRGTDATDLHCPAIQDQRPTTAQISETQPRTQPRDQPRSQPRETLKHHWHNLLQQQQQLVVPVAERVKKQTDIISKSFWDGKPAWIEDPVMKEWHGSKSKSVQAVLDQVNALYHEWDQPPGPFNTASDPLWTSTVAMLREVGLPLYTNNINMPDDVDDSWPFHFKAMERYAVVAKGSRVQQPDPSGYVCNQYEANLYGLRALQQELRAQVPTHQPLLVACRIDHQVLRYAAQVLGLEYLLLPSDWPSSIDQLLDSDSARDLGLRPIIFAATLANNKGQVDDFEAIRRLAATRPVFVHIDAARNFDYIASLSDPDRKRLSLPKLILCHPQVDGPTQEPGVVRAGSIVAGGISDGRYPFVVALKPRRTGSDAAAQLIEYTTGRDCTISGSRDGLGPLLMGLQEHRFDDGAKRKIYARCLRNREYIAQVLGSHVLRVSCPVESLDVIIHSPAKPCAHIDATALCRLGFISLEDDTLLGTVQPSVSETHVELLLGALGLRDTELGAQSTSLPAPPSSSRYWPLPDSLRSSLASWVTNWRRTAADSAGYPFNQAPYTALGPVVAHFLDRDIPDKWVHEQAKSLLNARKTAFGIREDNAHMLAQFGSSFTTGSTMGNQLGVQAAMAYAPHNHIYSGASSHYSLAKSLRDNDMLADRRWGDQRAPGPRFASIPVDASGRMQVPALVRQVVQDRAACAARGRPFGVTLFVNIGTTFAGGRDDIAALRRALLRDAGQVVGYVHADGALDFGFGPGAGHVRLGPPSIMSTCEGGGGGDEDVGVPVVQGITISHHKAYGMMVSGEVIYYDPSGHALPDLAPSVNPRAVLDAWLFQQIYTPKDLMELSRYCLRNANALRDALAAAGVFVLQDRTCTTVVLERPAPWVVVDFHLRVERDCAHYIAMPHISPEAVQRFVKAVTCIDEHYGLAFRIATPAFDAAMQQATRMIRVRQCAAGFASIKAFAEAVETQKYWDGSSEECVERMSDEVEQSLRSAVSIAVLDSDGRPIAVLLGQGIGLQRCVTMGPIIVLRDMVGDISDVWRIGKTTFEMISRLL